MHDLLSVVNDAQDFLRCYMLLVSTNKSQAEGGHSRISNSILSCTYCLVTGGGIWGSLVLPDLYSKAVSGIQSPGSVPASQKGIK